MWGGGFGSKVIWFSEQTKNGFVASFCYLPPRINASALRSPGKVRIFMEHRWILGLFPLPGNSQDRWWFQIQKRKRIFFKSEPSNLITSHQKYEFFQLKKGLATNFIPPIQTAHFMSVDFISNVISGPQNPWACLPPLFRGLHCTPHPKDLSEAFGRQAALVVSFKNRGKFPTNKRSLFVDDKEPL